MYQIVINIYLIVESMAKMGKKFLNINGEKFSGKTSY